MTIITIMSLAVMAFILGKLCRSSNNDFSCSHWDYEIKSRQLLERISILEKENEKFNFLYENMNMRKRCFQEEYAAHCYSCSKTFYSREVKDKDIAKMLNDITLTSEEIAKKLGVERTINKQ